MYIYKTICLINNKIYIGQCTKNKNKSKNYFGSGYILLKAINKYGANNFKKEILCECNTIEELNEKELDYIQKYDSTNKNIGYNIRAGGNNSFCAKSTKEKLSNIKKEMWKDKASVYNSKKYKLSRKGISPWNIGLTKDTDDRVAKYGMNGSKTLKKLYIEEKIKPWNKDKHNVYSSKTIIQMSNSAKNRKIDHTIEQLRRKKISKFMSNNHPKSIKILDTRDGKLYKNGKEFRQIHLGKNKNEMTWYKYKKLINEGIIIKNEN